MQLTLPIGEFIWRDASGNQSTTQIKFKANSPIADIDAALNGLASILLPLTGCTLVGQRIVYKSVELTPVLATSGSSVKQAGVFIFSDDIEEQWTITTLPSISLDVLVVDGVMASLGIDTDNTDVITFLDALVAAGFVNPFGENTPLLTAAYVQSRV